MYIYVVLSLGSTVPAVSLNYLSTDSSLTFC